MELNNSQIKQAIVKTYNVKEEEINLPEDTIITISKSSDVSYIEEEIQDLEREYCDVKAMTEANAIRLLNKVANYISIKLERCNYTFKSKSGAISRNPYLCLHKPGVAYLYCGNNDIFRIKFTKGKQPEVWCGKPLLAIDVLNMYWASYKSELDEVITLGLEKKLEEIRRLKENIAYHTEMSKVDIDI